jgi:hypothetical protein
MSVLLAVTVLNRVGKSKMNQSVDAPNKKWKDNLL